jgi:exodeoxyribonuclease-3
VKIATWNVNSIRARADRLVAWLTKASPDIVCLQETKVVDDDFPVDALAKVGYRSIVFGQRTYNGVAILSREPGDDVLRGFDDDVEDPQARLVSAVYGGVRVISAYFPNGRTVGSDKYDYKLQWMSRLRQWLDRTSSATDDLVLCGDYNVAPHDTDAARPESWADSVLCHPTAREALAEVRRFGLTDVVRRHHPDGGIYSWWDYRMLAFPKGNGLRIDHIFATESMAARCVEAYVLFSG